MGNLARGVNAGVRAAGTDDFDGFVCNNLECRFDVGLNAVPNALALPAVVRRSVVLQTDCNAHGGLGGQ